MKTINVYTYIKLVVANPGLDQSWKKAHHNQKQKANPRRIHFTRTTACSSLSDLISKSITASSFCSFAFDF
jgi:hypothetical protein